MLKPETLHAMKPEARTKLFESLCAAFYGRRLTAEVFAADFDVSRQTYFRWKRESNVPFAVLFTLDQWINSEAKAERIMQDWHDLPDQLQRAAEGLLNATRTLQRIARLSGVSDAPPPPIESAQPSEASDEADQLDEEQFDILEPGPTP
jgi:hypothetical protein